MNKKRGLLGVCVAIPLIVGGVSALLTREGMKQFSMFLKPPLSPPAWSFPLVWTILYVLMGLSSYLVLTSGKEDRVVLKALFFYFIQLIVNFCWSIFFFQEGWYWFSFAWLLLLWYLILQTIFAFWEVSPLSAYLMAPYLLWVTFAGYLNAGIAILN